MKLFQHVFKKWSPLATLEERIKALDELPQQDLLAIIEGSSGEENMDVRGAALMRLSYCSMLLDLALGSTLNPTTEKNKLLEKAARLRLAHFLDDKAINIGQLIAEVEDKETLLAIAAQCEDDTLQNVVLDSIDDQHQLANICSHSRSAVVRKIIVERIDQAELLRYLLKELKTKDKNVYKIAKQKLNKQKAQEDAVIQYKQTIEKLCDEMQQHSSRYFDKEYAPRYERLMQRWLDIESNAIAQPLIEKDQQQSFTANKARCQQRISEKQQQEDAERLLAKKLSSAHSDRQSLLEEVWQYINKLYNLDWIDELVFETLEEEKQQLISVWNELQQYGTISKKHSQQYQLLCQLVDDILQAYKDKGVLKICHERIIQVEDVTQIAEEDYHYFRGLLEPLSKPALSLSDFPPSHFLSSYLTTLENIMDKTNAREEFEKKQLNLILRLIQQSHTALDKGHLNKALGIRHSIDEKITDLSFFPQKYARKLELLTEALEKMVDWQAFVVVPKKHKLIEAMRALMGATMPIDELAAKIKKLQDQWKLLKQSGDDGQKELWETFSQLADGAYSPCKKHYQELSDTRKKNGEKRQQLVQRLEAFYQNTDWEHVECKQVEKTLATAKKEIYSYSPVDRVSNNKVMASFEVIKQSIQEKIDAKHEVYKQEKTQLIVRAQKLEEVKDIEQAISTAKWLQSQWKEIPRGNYKDDKQLWKQFRHHCDVVFDKKQALIDEHNKGLNENLDRANQLIRAIEQYLALSGVDFLSKRNEFSDCKAQFYQIEALPKGATNKVQKLFLKKCEQYEKKVSQQIAKIAVDSWQAFFSLVEKINNFQRTLATENADFDEIMTHIEHEISQVLHWPEGAKKIMSNRVKNMSIQNHEDELASKEILQILCIKMEVLTETDSPEEEKQKRLEYQVELLQNGAIANLSVEEESKKLALEWAAVEAVDPIVYEQCYKRFSSCWEKCNKITIK